MLKFLVWIHLIIIGLMFRPAIGSFIDMPDMTEVPDYRESSLLMDMNIPSVRERDPNPDSGPRLNVREFRIQGVVEYPELGITRQDIIDLVEKIRFDLMSEGDYLESGYTINEIAQVSDLVAELESDSKGRHVTSSEVQRLVFLIREQRQKRGVTLGMIETVADTITQYYRERGFILAKAYIPQQHVRDGVVVISLLLGKIGDIQVKGNRLYSEKMVARSFSSQVDQPVFNSSVEQSIYLVNDLPGLNASGYFEPGQQVGDTRLVVNVNDEQAVNANVRLDNHGSETTGEYRVYADAYWNNVTGMGDRLHVGLLGSYSPDNSLYGTMRYDIPTMSPKYWISMGASTNDFVTSSKSNSTSFDEVTGKSKLIDASIRSSIVRTRTKNHTAKIEYQRISSEIKFNAIANSGTSKTVDVYGAFWIFDNLNEYSRILHQGEVSLKYGRVVDESDLGNEKNSAILEIDYSRLKFLDFKALNMRSKWLVRVGMQYSGNDIPEVMQFGMSGPAKSRAYKINELYVDDGIYIGNDYIFESLFGFSSGDLVKGMGLSIKPYLFIDAAYGQIHFYETDEDKEESYLVDAGIGLKINFGNNISGDLSFAQPLSGKNPNYKIQNEDSSYSYLRKPGEGARLYFNLQYSY